MIEHTPGPWHLADDFATSGLIESDYGTIATVHGADNPDDETLPNARLVAAAPTLFRALKSLSTEARDRVQPTVAAEAEAAIAACLGERV